MTAAEILQEQIETAEARLEGLQEKAARQEIYQIDVQAQELVVLELRRALQIAISRGG